MNSYKHKEKMIKTESYNTIEEDKEKLKNLKEKNKEYLEEQLLVAKTATKLNKVIEEYDLKDPKNKQKRIISLLDPIYYANPINLLQV